MRKLFGSNEEEEEPRHRVNLTPANSPQADAQMLAMKEQARQLRQQQQQAFMPQQQAGPMSTPQTGPQWPLAPQTPWALQAAQKAEAANTPALLPQQPQQQQFQLRPPPPVPQPDAYDRLTMELLDHGRFLADGELQDPDKARALALEQQDRAQKYARRQMWSGLLSEIGSMGWTHQGFGQNQLPGLATKKYNDALAHNRQVLRNRLERKDKENIAKRQQWNQQLQYANFQKEDPAARPQIFGSASSGYYRLDENGEAVQLVGGVAPQLGLGELFANANTLRDDYESTSKGYRGQADAFQRVVDTASAYSDVNATKSDRVTADNALVFAFIKAQDPSSTVSAGEHASASNAPGVVGTARRLYNSVVNGESLTHEQRQSLLKVIQNSGRQGINGLNQLNQIFTERAERYGLPAGDIVRPNEYNVDGLNAFMGMESAPKRDTAMPTPIDQRAPASAPAPAPTTGTVPSSSVPGLIDLGIPVKEEYL